MRSVKSGVRRDRPFGSFGEAGRLFALSWPAEVADDPWHAGCHLLRRADRAAVCMVSGTRGGHCPKLLHPTGRIHKLEYGDMLKILLT